MKVVITGGGGFLGSQLSQKLLERGQLAGEPLEEIVLIDAFFRGPPQDARVRHACGDVGSKDFVFESVGSARAITIFHLASMVSGECEERFDDALRVNLDGSRHIFECARSLPGRPRVVFASSIACFGGEGMMEVNSDGTKHTPQTTYGMTKAICEMLVNDYTRKGFFDGRAIRLPTVIIRPGKPNAAASSWASGMFREPLNGEDCLLPVHRDQRHPMTGYRAVVESFIKMAEVPESVLGTDRAYVLPAHTVTPRLAESAIQEVSVVKGLKLGRIVDAPDARIQRIVDNWPQAVDGTRSKRIGMPSPPPLREMVEHYVDDFLQRT
ncbi:MAG: NAD-dependent epimerase/dehydratase family protein [Verrucomicrobiaceae bacterium]|nr:NAD-dependent epimerase/dehydratase family protein [Verrucomicrobiaceae bacterium]